MKLKYGVISCAAITDRFISAVQDSQDCVQAIASRSLEKAKKQAAKYKIPKAYGSYEELYQDDHIDIVYIATNNATHKEEIYKALTHHKHVLCEKPMVLSGKDAVELFNYAKKQNCFLMEAQKSIFLPITHYLKNLIENETLGKLCLVDMTSSFPSPSSQWMHDKTQGGVVFGSATYTLEYLEYLIKPKKKRIQALMTYEENKTCDSVSFNIKMDDILIHSTITMRCMTDNHAVFYFEKGKVMIENYWKARKAILYGKSEEIIHYPIDHEMIYEISHVHDCLAKKLLESPLMSADMTIDCCRIVDEIIQKNDSDQ